jgi:hypothetical protein
MIADDLAIEVKTAALLSSAYTFPYPLDQWKLQVGQIPGDGGRKADGSDRGPSKGEKAYGGDPLTEIRRPIMEEYDDFCSRYTPQAPAGGVVKFDRNKRRRIA